MYAIENVRKSGQFGVRRPWLGVRSGLRRGAAAILCGLLALSAATAAQASWAGGTWTTLDIPGAWFTTPCGVSGGIIVGRYNPRPGSDAHGFVYDGTSFATADYPGTGGGMSTFLNGVDGNTAVGTYGRTGWTFEGRIYNITTYAWTRVVSPYSGYPNLVLRDKSGDRMVGYVWDGDQQAYGKVRAVLFDGTTWSMIHPPDAYGSQAYGISGGTIVGSYTDSSWQWHSFVYDGTGYVTLEMPGATQTGVTGISGGTIIGAYADAVGAWHGFVYDGTTWETLDMPGASLTAPTAIDGNTIVGYYADANGMYHGFVYTIPVPAKLPPMADANGPYVAHATSWAGASLSLDGTASYDPDYPSDADAITAYRWDLDLAVDSDGDGDPRNDVDGTGPTPTAEFPIGQTDIALVVVDRDRLSSKPTVTTVTVSTLHVTVDIKPGSDQNTINLGSNGVVPVAFLTTPDFDATTINPRTVTLRGEDFSDGLVKLRGKKDAVPMATLVDVDGDGHLDLLVQLDTERLAEYELTAVCEFGALTYDGYVVSGSDTVRAVPAK